VIEAPDLADEVAAGRLNLAATAAELEHCQAAGRLFDSGPDPETPARWTMSTVSFMAAGPARPPECPCGSVGTDRRTHAKRHMQWATGAPVPASLDAAWPPDSIAVVTTTGPAAWRRLAYELAQVARRAGGYDFASFPPPIGRGGPDPQHTRAFLYRHHDRSRGNDAVGYLALSDEPTIGRYNPVTQESSDAGQGQVRPTVGLIFVAYHLRRSGIGSALICAAAEHAAVTPSELAWWTPFTDAGAALAQSVAGPDGAVWIA
jgi:GNAT superfamily N-acetyltransferase